LGDSQSPVRRVTFALVTLYVPSRSGKGLASNVKLFELGLYDRSPANTVVTLKTNLVSLAGN